jgi:hypothetical protein
MDLPSKVFVYSGVLNLSGAAGTLVAIRPEGCFELRLISQGKPHVVLLPVASTGIVVAEPEPEFENEVEIER